jgi:hypothetical protein
MKKWRFPAWLLAAALALGGCGSLNDMGPPGGILDDGPSSAPKGPPPCPPRARPVSRRKQRGPFGAQRCAARRTVFAKRGRVLAGAVFV